MNMLLNPDGNFGFHAEGLRKKIRWSTSTSLRITDISTSETINISYTVRNIAGSNSDKDFLPVYYSYFVIYVY